MIELPTDLDQAWEPRTFKVGDRVVVKVTPECPAHWLEFIHQKYPITGAIEEITKAPDYCWEDLGEDARKRVQASHRFFVGFDVWVMKESGGAWSGGHFAAVELELLKAGR